MTFGSPFSTVNLDPLAPPILSSMQSLLAGSDQRPVSHLSAPDSPPPEVLQAPSLFV